MSKQNRKTITVTTDQPEWLYIPDVVYWESEGLKRCLQIIVPYKHNWEQTKKVPLVLFIPGSAWHRQEMYNNIPARAKLAKRGFAIAEVQYRESDLAVFPAQVIDVKRAIRFLHSFAEQFPIDINHIFLAGDSSGGHIALLTGLTADSSELDDVETDIPYNINGIISFYAPTDMFLTRREGPIENLLGVSDVTLAPWLAEAASCKTYITKEKSIPPILMFHGKEDETVSIENSRNLFAILEKYDKDVEYYEIEKAGHGGAVYWTDEILDIVEKFIRKFY